MKPIIGISPSIDGEKMFLQRDYVDAVYRAGGIPFVLSLTSETEDILNLVTDLDGLLLSGGEDVDPIYFHEEPLPGLGEVSPERDHFEITLSRSFLKANKPILAICRGCQVLNIAAGGDIYQDLPSQRKGLIQHIQRAPKSHATHQIQVVEGSLLYQIVGSQTYRVNSFHHQAVRRVASPFFVTATAVDGVIEAFESKEHTFVLGVQWHPEGMAQRESVAQQFFNFFVSACNL